MRADYTDKHVLFVDDDILIHRSIKRLLLQEKVEWKYSFASAVDEALETIRANSIDAVILDIKMPGRDGFELLAELRGNRKWEDLPIVMLTGLDNPGLKSKALEMGATDLLNKPINSAELIARIHSVLYLKQCQDHIKQQNIHLEELVLKRTEALEATRLDMILRLAKAAEFKSQETGHHVIRVGYYSRIIAKKHGLSSDYCKMIFLTSPLHDIGKIGIADSILEKSGKLSTAERDIMKTHCSVGKRLLSRNSAMENIKLSHSKTSIKDILDRESNPFLEMAAEIAGGHHERWDGNGYPDGLSAESIPFSARIVAIADVYDALRSKRSYKPEMAHLEVAEVMEEKRGTHFDPDLFDTFKLSLEAFKKVALNYPDQ